MANQYDSKAIHLYDGGAHFKIGSSMDMLNGLPQGSPVYSLEYKASDGTAQPISINSLYVEIDGNQQPVAGTLAGIRLDFTDEKVLREQDSSDLWTETERLDSLVYYERLARVQAITGLTNGIIFTNNSDINLKANAIRADLTAETNARASRDTQLTNLLTAESFDRLSADTAMGLRVGTEEQARLSGDNYLVVQLAQEVSDRGVAIQGVQASVVAEAKARGDVDYQLQTAIDALGGSTLPALTLDYKAEDAKLRALIVQEVADRQAKDGLQDDALQTEVWARRGDTAATEAKIVVEFNRAYQAETALNSRIDFVVSNSTPASLDSLAEIVAKFNADGLTYADRLTQIEGVLARLTAP